MQQKIDLAARILLGLIFTVFGLNGLIMAFNGTGFIPAPPPPPEMMPIMTGFMAMVYLLPLVKLLEVIGGVLLLSGKYINAAIVILAPIVVNILGIHLFVELSGAPMAIFITILLIILIKNRWSAFRPLLAR